SHISTTPVPPSTRQRFHLSLFFYGYGDHRDLHSFPTRRSSDLGFQGGPSKARCRYCTYCDPSPLAWTYVHYGRRGREGRMVRERSEEHTSELQSRENLVCRLLLEKKKKKKKPTSNRITNQLILI